MAKFFIDNEKQINGDKLYLTGKDVNHIKKVLRKQVGDILIIGNKENKQTYEVKIEQLEKIQIICHILKQLEEKVEPNIQVTIFQGLPKADKMELIIQKSTELGVFAIAPMQMKRSIVKIKQTEEQKKIQRWQTIAEVAAKQSRRAHIPEILQIRNIKQVLEELEEYDYVMVAYEQEEDNSIKKEIEQLKKWNKKDLKIAIIIGPEGGLDLEEISLLEEKGATCITLGKRILRTETVAFTMLSILMYELGDLN